MAAAALLSVTLVPALMVIFVRGRIIPEQRNPLNKALIWLYRPIIAAVLKSKDTDHPARSRGARHHALASEPTRLGVHAEPRRGHAVLHADDAAGHLDHQGGGPAAIPGPHHQIVSRGAFGLRQGGPRFDGDRSGADRDVRDHHQSQAQGSMASRRDDRLPDRRDGQGLAVSGRVERLDHADQGAHRHAVDRHSHAGRRQGLRHRPRPRWSASRGRSSRFCEPFQAPRAPMPSASSAATTSTSRPIATRSPAMASWSATSRR